MKRILSILAVGLLLSVSSFAQRPGTAKVSPATFTAEDQITITFDLSTTTWASGTEDVYIWCFAPGDAPANTADGHGWTNSNPITKMTPLGGGKYSFTLTPTTWMNETPAQIGNTFGCLAKTQNGSSQTDDQKFTVDALTFTPGVFRVFPAKFTQDDAVTFFLDKNLLDPNKNQTLIDSAVYVYTDIDYIKPGGGTGFYQTSMFCANGVPEYTGETFVGDNPDLKAKDLGNGLWSWTIVPSAFYKIGDASNAYFPPAGSTITQIKVKFRTRQSKYCFGNPSDDGSIDDNTAKPVIQ